MNRRDFILLTSGSLLTMAAIPPPSAAQPFTSLFSPARDLGDFIAGLLGVGHPDREIDEIYFNQIISNQERIIHALGHIASSIEHTAKILDLIPYQTNEIEETIRAIRVFIKSQGLLTAISDALTTGTPPTDQAFIDAFTRLVEDVDDSTASYLSAIATLGQSHDLCVSVRPLWNAVQSARDAGRVTQALSPGHSALLKESARRILDICDDILDGSSASPTKFGVFRTRYTDQLRLLDSAAQTLTDYRTPGGANVHFFEFQPEPGFYFGKGPDVLHGSTHMIVTDQVMDCGPFMNRRAEFSIETGPDCKMVEAVLWESNVPATLTRTRLSPTIGSDRIFSLSINPQRDGAVINSYIEIFNSHAAQFYHYSAVEQIIMDVKSEIEEKIDTL